MDYFRNLAPDNLTIPSPNNSLSPPPVEFVRQQVQLLREKAPLVVSHVQSVPRSAAHDSGLLVCDMLQGHFIFVDPNSPAGRSVELGKFHNPAHVKITDLDGDNELDFVIADLGSYLPADHNKGKVYWLKQNKDDES